MAWVRACALFVGVTGWAASSFAKPETLPLKRVRFYETGVAYFERSGALKAGAVSLPVPQSHLDDALKTLVVYSKAGATRVGGVEFGSSVSPSMGRALAGMEPGAGPLGLAALLQSLKGANLVLTLDGGSLEGRLVEVLDADTSDLERCLRVAVGQSRDADGCKATKVPALVVLTKTNDLRRVALADVRGARPTDAAIGARLNAALDALAGGSARVLKELRVLAQGQSVSLGYVSEAPVWRASYRLVLGEERSAALQGWALIHNDTDESWHGVTLELVNGRPDSFLFPLAAPRYARRELVTPDNQLSTVPQLLRTTPDAMWNVDDDEGSGEVSLSARGEGGGGRGEGIGLGDIGTLGHGAGTANDDASSLLSVGNLAATATSEGVESGALFRYTLSDKLDLRAHGSALVPFVGQGIEARRIALFRGDGSAALSAVAITHRGTQTLPAGTLAVFSDGGFAGESALPRLKPSETTTVEFGADLDVARTHDADVTSEEPRVIQFEDEELVEHYVLHHRVTEHLENRGSEPRSVFIELDYVNNASVTGAEEVVFDSQKQHAYAVFGVGRRESVSRTLAVAEGLSRRQSVRVLTSTRLLALAAASSLPEAQRAVLRRAAAELAAAEAKRRSLRAETATLALAEDDAKRLREHVQALGAARGTEELVARVVAAEDRAEATRRGVRALRAEADALGRQATRTLAELGH
jgi:hypothetical protein